MSDIVVFDYDGVIVDSRDLFAEFYQKGCQAIDREDLGSADQFISLFDGNMYESMLSLGISKEEMLKIIFTMRSGLLKNQQDLRIFDGIANVVRSLHEAGIKLLIVTSNETRVVKEYLKTQGLDVFDKVIGSDRQPSKIVVLKDLLRQHPKDRIHYIGDTCGDVLEGRTAGALTTVVTWGFHDKRRLMMAEPDVIVDTPEELCSQFLVSCAIEN